MMSAIVDANQTVMSNQEFGYLVGFDKGSDSEFPVAEVEQLVPAEARLVIRAFALLIRFLSKQNAKNACSFEQAFFGIIDDLIQFFNLAAALSTRARLAFSSRLLVMISVAVATARAQQPLAQFGNHAGFGSFDLGIRLLFTAFDRRNGIFLGCFTNALGSRFGRLQNGFCFFRRFAMEPLIDCSFKRRLAQFRCFFQLIADFF